MRFWNESAEAMKDVAIGYCSKYITARSDFIGSFNISNDTWNVRCVGLYDLCMNYGITDEKMFTETTERTSSDFQRGLIRGFFDADGSVQGDLKKGVSIRLAQNDIPRLQVIQRMLLRFGIISSLYKNRTQEGMKPMPDGKGGYKDYLCKAMHELCIANDNIVKYAELIGFHEPAKTKRINEIINSYKRPPNKSQFFDSIAEIKPVGHQKVYDITVNKVHEFCANGIRAHNCAEVILKPYEFCNLTEVVCRESDTVDTLLRKVRIATIIGTYQSSLTNFTFIDPKWIENQKLERLLGVSLTGMWDCEMVREARVLNQLKVLALEINQEYAHRFEINRSAAITLVKPSGTVSQMVNSASGIHARFSKYYIRRIRIAATDPLLKLMKAQGYKAVPEVGQNETTANTFVLSFPVKSPDNAKVVDDLTALQQLEFWKRVKMEYCEHNPSCTIYVKNDEWLDIAQWIWKNWEYIIGLSFLPYSDHVYELAPYEAITKEKYEELKSQMTKVDFSKLIRYEKYDSTDMKKELACVGGVCEL